MVTIGSGAIGGQVTEALDPHGVSFIGGRISQFGVAGVILGGTYRICCFPKHRSSTFEYSNIGLDLLNCTVVAAGANLTFVIQPISAELECASLSKDGYPTGISFQNHRLISISNPLASHGKDNVEELKIVAVNNDQSQFFQKLQAGGFLLSRVRLRSTLPVRFKESLLSM
ncbi:hypothetical protein B0J11DRAFT_512775 [Dendryphion nanum]|uniref:Uncharacterized protein n=1 Tax=Dendryphion nanum TaxID=256645 RepID=A0A9P9CXU6_9PLEO|nr:hypothetical protein B0J11DRAFT_512775 [Dendryphion nanum]